MGTITFADKVDHKKIAGTYLMFSILEDKNFENAINKFLFQLFNSNQDFEFEPQDYPHVTLFATPQDLSYSGKLEAISYIRSILPPSQSLIDLEVVGLDFFSEDKKTLVVRLHSDTLEELNKKLCDFMQERGVAY